MRHHPSFEGIKMKIISFIVCIIFISTCAFADFAVTLTASKTNLSNFQSMEVDPNNITSLNEFEAKTLKVLTPIQFPNRKNLSELARTVDGRPFYWQVAVLLKDGTFEDVKDVTYDSQEHSCTFAFNLSDHAGFETPYILGSGEILEVSHITKATSSANNLYYIHFQKPDFRFTLICRSPLDSEFTADDFNSATKGILELEAK